MPVAGVEPAPRRRDRILSPARLPIPPYRHITRPLYHNKTKKSIPFKNFIIWDFGTPVLRLIKVFRKYGNFFEKIKKNEKNY